MVAAELPLFRFLARGSCAKVEPRLMMFRAATTTHSRNRIGNRWPVGFDVGPCKSYVEFV